MKTRMGRILALTAVLVVLAAGAAVAADQTVDISVLEANTLSVQVDDSIWLGAEVGQTSQTGFNLGIVNTQGVAWEVTALTDGFEGYYEDNCDEYGCEYFTTGIDLPPSAMTITGGDSPQWGDPDAIVGYTQVLDDVTPMVIVTGTSETYGSYVLDDPWSEMAITIPADDSYVGQYRGVVTYTISPAP